MEQIQIRPIAYFLRDLTNDIITVENFEQKFIKMVEIMFLDYLLDLDIPDEDMRIIRNSPGERMPLLEDIVTNFATIVDDDDGLGPIIGPWLYYLLTKDGCGNENVLYFVTDDVVNEIKIFIGVTHSTILKKTTKYNNTELTEVLIDFIACITYWYGIAWLLKWSKNEMVRRFTYKHLETVDDAKWALENNEETEDDKKIG
jgi:hypothetical protein